jgi:hypothetical protein
MSDSNLDSHVSPGPPRPLVSIGLPVYNGERFIVAAIDSILGQTMADFELIVCDNASTDRTAEIVTAFAAADDRVRLHRNPANVGPIPNFNLAFELARGRYFKWLGADDTCESEFLGRCLDHLEAEPDLVLCSARFVEIDQEGAPLGLQPYDIDLSGSTAHERLGRFMSTARGHQMLYGLIRADVLRRTHLLAPYHGSDRALLAELALHGAFREIPDVLWSSRDHPGRSPYVDRLAGDWQPRTTSGPAITHLAITAHMLRVIRAAPLPAVERVRCLGALVGAVAARSGELAPTLGRELADLAGDRWHRVVHQSVERRTADRPFGESDRPSATDDREVASDPESAARNGHAA